MCKLLAIVDIKNQKAADEYLKASVPFMTQHDNDGLGIIRLNKSRTMGVAKWQDVTQYPHLGASAMRGLNKWGPVAPSGGVLIQGKMEGPAHALGIHSRKATCGKSLQNTHPFVKDGIALIHNGIITNHSTAEKTLSTCDSEALLTWYLLEDVKSELSNIQGVYDSAEGWFAFMAFHEKTGFLDIAVDARTPLYICAVEGVGTVICTSENVLDQTKDEMGVDDGVRIKIPPMTAIRWKPGNAEIERYDAIDNTPAVSSTIPAIVKPSVWAQTCIHGKRYTEECLQCEIAAVDQRGDIIHG